MVGWLTCRAVGVCAWVCLCVSVRACPTHTPQVDRYLHSAEASIDLDKAEKAVVALLRGYCEEMQGSDKAGMCVGAPCVCRACYRVGYT